MSEAVFANMTSPTTLIKMQKRMKSSKPMEVTSLEQVCRSPDSGPKIVSDLPSSTIPSSLCSRPPRLATCSRSIITLKSSCSAFRAILSSAFSTEIRISSVPRMAVEEFQIPKIVPPCAHISRPAGGSHPALVRDGSRVGCMGAQGGGLTAEAEHGVDECRDVRGGGSLLGVALAVQPPLLERVEGDELVVRRCRVHLVHSRT